MQKKMHDQIITFQENKNYIKPIRCEIKKNDRYKLMTTTVIGELVEKIKFVKKNNFMAKKIEFNHKGFFYKV